VSSRTDFGDSKLSNEELVDRVVEYLRWHPNAKPSEIADFLGVNPRIVRVVLARLRSKGVVVRTEKGYSLRIGSEKVDAGVEKEVEKKDVLQKNQRLGVVEETVFEKLIARIEELEKRIVVLEKDVEELKRILHSKNETNYSLKCEEVYEALEFLKMGLEAVRVGDQNSLNSILNEVEELLEKIRKCFSA